MNNSYRPFGGFGVFPPVIKNLLIINVIVFFIQILASNLLLGGEKLGYLLNEWFALNPIVEGANFQVWQLITFQFMHSTRDIFHILFNMFMLWMFGRELEIIWGSKKFLIYYLLAGVVAGLFQVFITPLIGLFPAQTIGASGGVYGVLIGFALMFPDRYLLLIIPPVPVKAKYLIGFFIVIEILAVDSAQSTVAHLAHLGGALAGFLFIMLDKSIDVPLKRMLNISSGYRSGNQFQNPFSGISSKFKRRKEDIAEADYYDIDQKKDIEKVSQAEIDAILDKISQSGYQNLTEREKQILFEASKKMN